MRVSYFLLSCVFASIVAFAEEPAKPAGKVPDPRTIVQKSAEAIGKLKIVAYDVEFKVSGFFEMFLPNINGQVVMGKESVDGFKRFHCKVKIQKADSADATEVTAGADGNIYYLIDDKAKTVYADMDPQVMGKQRDGIDFTLTPEFGMAHPFEDALNSGDIKYLRDETVGGQDCWVLVFKSAMSKPFMDWYISKSDFLPRRVVFTFKDPKGNEGGSQATILNLKVDPKLEKDPFVLVVPPGYKKTDDFAP
jgi:outer membrane lipoprotein-sorting protein